MTPEEQRKKILDTFRELKNAGEVVINGRHYKFLSCAHAQRKRIFGVYSKYQGHISSQDFSFTDNPDFVKAEKDLSNVMVCDDEQVCKLIESGHWDRHPEDYFEYLIKCMGVVSYPFMSGSGGV